MCTSLIFTTDAPYFGRNLDLEYDFGQQVVITPRRFPLTFKAVPPLERHYAMIGMATVAAGWPLYAEAMNEKGLYLAGLNFPHSARYPCGREDGLSLGPYELIPWLLGTCETADQAVEQLRRIRLLQKRPENRLLLRAECLFHRFHDPALADMSHEQHQRRCPRRQRRRHHPVNTAQISDLFVSITAHNALLTGIFHRYPIPRTVST